MENQQVTTLLALPNKPGYFCDETGKIISRKRLKEKVITARLSYGRSKNPYLRVKVAGKLHLVHRLVLSAVIGRELKPDEFVNHKNAITTDNSIGNLELVSHKENVKHAVDNKLYCSGDAWYKARGRTPSTIETTRKRNGVEYTQAGGNGRHLIEMVI